MTWRMLLVSAGVLAALGSASASGAAMVQGKTVTMFSGTGPGVLPVFPATVTAASVPLPTKHKSKKHTLVVTTTIEESCPSDQIATIVSVAGFSLEPDPDANS